MLFFFSIHVQNIQFFIVIKQQMLDCEQNFLILSPEFQAQEPAIIPIKTAWFTCNIKSFSTIQKC